MASEPVQYRLFEKGQDVFFPVIFVVGFLTPLLGLWDDGWDAVAGLAVIFWPFLGLGAVVACRTAGAVLTVSDVGVELRRYGRFVFRASWEHVASATFDRRAFRPGDLVLRDAGGSVMGTIPMQSIGRTTVRGAELLFALESRLPEGVRIVDDA